MSLYFVKFSSFKYLTDKIVMPLSLLLLYFIVDCVLHSSVEIMIVFDTQVDDFMDRKQALGQIINISFRFKENMTIGVVTDSSNPKFIFTTCWSKN